MRMRVLLTLLTLMMLLGVMIVPAMAQDSEPVTVTDAFGNEVTIEDTSSIVTIGGAVTETVFALGMGREVVAVDESSIYPAGAAALPQVGYIRFLAAEPILAVEPTLVITTVDVGPVEVVDQLEDAGITVLIVPADDTLEGTVEKITTIAAALNKVEEGAALLEQLQADIAQAETLRESVETAPKVMFVFVRGQAVLTVSGTGTGADEMIRLAGAENAVTDYEGYQPINAEAVIAAAPDVILTTSGGVESIGGMDAFMELPGIADTPAAENGRIIAGLDDLYLLGFTPRLGEAILDLTYLIHDEIPRPLPVVARLNGGFPTLLRGLVIADYVDRLSAEGPFTIFAPDEDAFGTLPAGMLMGLYSSPISVQAVLGFHVVEGIYTSEDLAAMDGETLPTLYGAPLTISVGDDGTISINDTVQIITPDVEASNGIIHIINGVLVPARP